MIGENQTARTVIAAPHHSQRWARKGIGGEQRQRRIEPVAEPVCVGEPGEKARDHDIGGGVGERRDDGQQPVGSGVGRSPRRVEVRDRAAHRHTARGIGAGKMVVAGWHAVHRERRGNGGRRVGGAARSPAAQS